MKYSTFQGFVACPTNETIGLDKSKVFVPCKFASLKVHYTYYRDPTIRCGG
jgi:hypothetical protein